MDYLRAFTIGSSGLIIFSTLNYIKNFKEDEIDNYVFIIPIYYGIMAMLSLLIGNLFNLSLNMRLFIISIISSIIITLYSNYINRYDKYIQEKPANKLYIIIQDIIRQIIIFNIIIYYFTINLSKSYPIKLFVIGSSIFSYFITYYRVLEKKKELKYSYKYFAINEPFIQGIFWMIGVYILHKILKIKLLNSLILYQIISSILMALIAKIFNLYTYKKIELIKYLSRMIIVGFIKIPGIYLLIKNL